MSKIPTHEEIEVRAYEIYLGCRCENGHEVQHWLEAEEQLSAPDAEEASTSGAASQSKTATAGSQNR